MSALIQDKLITPCGSLVDTSATNYVDVAGNLRSSPQFLSSLVVDYAGNLGAISLAIECLLSEGRAVVDGVPDAASASIGVLNFPGETHVDIWTTDGQDITTDRAVTAVAVMGSKEGTTIIQSGVLSGASAMTIGGTNRWLGEYFAGGTVVFAADNTHTGAQTIDPAGILQLGLNTSATTGRVLGTTTNNGDLNILGANTTLFNKTAAILNNPGGVVNYIGPDACGEGDLGALGAVTNNSTINITDAQFTHSTSLGGTGIVNVNDGGTIKPLGTMVATQTINLNGCGWRDADCVEQGAIHMATINGQSAVMNVQTASCIKSSITGVVQLNGRLEGSAPLHLSNTGTGTSPQGTIKIGANLSPYDGPITADGITLTSNFTGLANADVVLTDSSILGGTWTIGSIASTDPTTLVQSLGGNNVINDNGVTEFAGRFQSTGASGNIYLRNPGNELTHTGVGNTANFWVQLGAKYIMDGATYIAGPGQLRVQTGSSISAGDSLTNSSLWLIIDGTSALDVDSATPGKISYVNHQLLAGWKVNLNVPMTAGTYTLLESSATTYTVLPTLGVNNSGLTPVFTANNATVPRTLTMTLS